MHGKREAEAYTYYYTQNMILDAFYIATTKEILEIQFIKNISFGRNMQYHYCHGYIYA